MFLAEKKLLMAVAILGTSAINLCSAQKFIILMRHRTKEKVIILPGDRVKCKFKSGAKIVGIMQNIDDSTFTLNNKKYAIETLDGIAKRKKGSGVFIASILFGAPIVFTQLMPQPKLSEVGLFGALVTLVITKPALDYIMHYARNWDIEVVDFVPMNKSGMPIR